MFDVYSQCSVHARSAAFLHPETLPTWPDMAKQNREADIEVRLYRDFSENPFSQFAASVSARFQRWQQTIWSQPVKRARVHRTYYFPAKRRSPVHR